jgi:hypothetical protein
LTIFWDVVPCSLVILFEVLSQHLPLGTQEIHEDLSQDCPCAGRTLSRPPSE